MTCVYWMKRIFIKLLAEAWHTLWFVTVWWVLSTPELRLDRAAVLIVYGVVFTYGLVKGPAHVR